MRRRVLMVIALGLACGLALLGVSTPLLGNVWLSATDSDFRVPQQSSLVAAAGCAGFDPRDVTTWCGR